jgi:pimeloyl-ACP methyl ester carboxylesterase
LLVLLHGLASNMTRWSEFVAHTSLKPTWNIVRLDLRGQGASVHRGAVGIGRWCEDLAALLAAEPHDQVVLAGHCLGANIALEFARTRPQAVTGLILIEPIFAEALQGTLKRAMWLRPALPPLAALVRGLNALGVHRRRLRPLDLAVLDRDTRAAIAAGRREALREGYASPAADLACTPLAVYLQALVVLTRQVADLSEIRTPTLALLSTGGAYGDATITERRLAALPRGRIVWLDADHWIPMERPDEMRECIDAWCRSVGGP